MLACLTILSDFGGDFATTARRFLRRLATRLFGIGERAFDGIYNIFALYRSCWCSDRVGSRWVVVDGA